MHSRDYYTYYASRAIMKKDKNTAGILALFLGGFGIHQFYLGQTGWGILHLIFFWTPFPWIFGLVTAIILFSMDQEKFDARYNSELPERPDFRRRRDTDFDRYRPRREYREAPRRERGQFRLEKRENREWALKVDTLKKSGLKKFRDYDYSGAIEDFENVLVIDPKDIAAHFNLACAYSLTENAEKSFYHLDQAVCNGFDDFAKIKTHDALAYLRIQDEFYTFEKNSFRLLDPQPTEAPKEKEEDLLSSQPDLLDQLRKLDEQRNNGLLTEEEFVEEKKKLLG